MCGHDAIFLCPNIPSHIGLPSSPGVVIPNLKLPSLTQTKQGRECQILLQNENGPCPLLAAANCLLLQGRITLPASSIRNNVASLEDLTNVLANVALERSDDQANVEHSFHMNELLEHIPSLQYGMVR